MFNKNMRNGFSMYEIIIAIIVSSALSIAGLKEWNKYKYEENFNSFLEATVNILKNGVMNHSTGYTSGTGSPCSETTNYTGLTADRLISCVGWNNIQVGGVGVNSYIYDLMKGYNSNIDNRVCKLSFKEGISSNQYYFFIDCSELYYDNALRNRELAEELIENKIKTIFPTKYKTIYRNASSIDVDGGGSSDDGYILVLMEN